MNNTHISDNELNSADKKRFRITRACDYCRKKKVKCYFVPGQACSNCIATGITCEFNDGAKKRGPPKGYIDALEKRIKRIEESLQNPIRHDTIPSSNKKTQSSSDKVQYLGDMSSFQFFSNKIRLDESRNATWKGHRIRKFGKQVVLVEEEQQSEQECQIPQSQLLPHLKSIHHWIYSVTGVDKNTSDRLIKIYFANIHPVLPVVNKSAFLKQYRDRADTYPPPDLLNAMFGAAARFVECEARQQKSKPNRAPEIAWDVPPGWSDQLFDQSQLIVSTSASVPTISKIQAIILVHNHSGNLDSKSSACWLLGGLAIRLAQGLGLNRNCDEWDIPDDEKQTRKRIWWSLYVADRFHSASLGRPISIRDEDNDVGYPEASASWKEVLDESEEDLLGDPRFPSAMCRPKKVEGKVGIYQLFIELIKLAEILGRILQGLYTPKAKKVGLEQGSDAVVTDLDHQLTEWRFGFAEALQKSDFEDFEENRGYFAPVTASVLLCYFSLLILLHRPFIEANDKKAKPSYSSFRIGTSAATRGMRIASQMSVKDMLMFPYSFSLYPILQCCLIHMYNTKNPDIRISAPAKADLKKGMVVISRLRIISNTAQRLHSLLKVIMSNKEIEVPHQSDSEESVKSRDNNHTIRPVMPSIPMDYNSLHHFQPPLSEVIAPPNIETTVSQSSAPSPTSVSEAFSLQQFGFNKSLEEIYNNQGYPIMPTSFNYAQQFNEGLFRNNPNNPFFSIPASMDWTEWNEWNQSSQGNTNWQQLV